MESNSWEKSLAKALTWRILATVTTTIIAYALTGQIKTALAISGSEFVIKMGMYYFHERAWEKWTLSK